MLRSTRTRVADVERQTFTDPDSAHSSIDARFSLGEPLPISLNAPVNEQRLTSKTNQ